MCYHDKFGHSVSKGVGISRENRQKLESGARPLRWGRGWPPENTPLTTYVTIPNLVVLGQIVWVLVGVHQKLGSAEVAPRTGGVLVPLQTSSASHVGYHAKFDCCWSNGMSVRMETRRKNWDSRVPPFKVTQGHQNW